MRNPSLLLLIVVFILAPFKLSAAADTVVVRETRIPVLIERQDNELFHLRIEATQSQMLNEVKLDFGKDVNLNEIESVKLYYGGTESVERRGKTYFAPVDYISNNTPGKTLAANTSYSVLKSEVKAPKREVVLKADQKLFPGVNYFWISLQMKPVASILSKVSAEVVEAKIDGQVAPLKIARIPIIWGSACAMPVTTGLLPIVFPDWPLQIKEPCWGYMMYAIIIVRIYRSMWK